MQDTLSRRPPARGSAAVPPSRRAPGTTGTRRRRRQDPLWARLTIVLGALLMMASGGTIVSGKVLIGRYAGSIKQGSLVGGAADVDSKGRVSIKGAINLLLVGIDESADRIKDGMEGARADSIMIVHVTADHTQAFMVSIPRDAFVEIPAYKKSGYTGGSGKVNAAFLFGSQNGGGRAGGFELLALTIHQLTGIRFTGGGIVNFDGFKAMVDALGGVDMYVDEETTSIHMGWDAKGKYLAPFFLHDDGTVAGPNPRSKPMVYHVGYQHLASWQALDYCRQRDLLANGDSDYGRARHQQQFIRALVKETLSKGVLTNPVKLDKVMKAAGQAFTFDGGGVAIEDWIFTLKGLDPNNMIMVKTNAGKFNPKTLPDGTIAEALNEDSLQLLRDVHDDKVVDFVTSHPDWVSRDH